jgi:hypothetical protein
MWLGPSVLLKTVERHRCLDQIALALELALVKDGFRAGEGKGRQLICNGGMKTSGLRDFRNKRLCEWHVSSTSKGVTLLKVVGLFGEVKALGLNVRSCPPYMAKMPIRPGVESGFLALEKNLHSRFHWIFGNEWS